MERHRRRIVTAGSLILAVAFLAGVAFTWFTLRDASLHPDETGFLGRSTVVPLLFIVAVFPVTIPVLGIAGVLVFIGMRKQKFWWLAIVGILGVTVYWLFWVLIAGRVPLD